MDLCAGLVFCVMMIAIWLDDTWFCKWLKKIQINGERNAGFFCFQMKLNSGW